jgi:hypothetical protein
MHAAFKGMLMLGRGFEIQIQIKNFWKRSTLGKARTLLSSFQIKLLDVLDFLYT